MFVFIGTTAVTTLSIFTAMAHPSPSVLMLAIVAVAEWGAALGAFARAGKGGTK